MNAKVVVGYYATEKQAEVAKSIMQDAGVNTTPVVKTSEVIILCRLEHIPQEKKSSAGG